VIIMRIFRTLTTVIVVLGLGATMLAQAVTEADLAKLDAAASEINQRVANLKASDSTLAAEVERSLALLKEDIVYLRVRLRREGTVQRADFAEVRDRLETLRIKSLGQKVTGQPVLTDDPKTGGEVWVVPVGTEIDVRLQTALNSATAKVEQRFEATTLVDLKLGGEVRIPAGTIVRGFVGSVRAAGRIERKGSLTLAFDEILLPNGPSRLRASVSQALDGKASEDISRIGTGAALGAIVGGLLGGGKGLLLGVLVGGGGTIAATDGSDVNLPIGTVLRLRVDAPLEIR
jgi:hypothetical protein